MNTDLMKSIGAASVAFAMVGAVQAATVYEAVPGGNYSLYTTAQHGDQITLGGSETFITGFSVRYDANYSLADGLTLRFYENNGPAGAPQSLIYESQFNISSGVNDLNVAFDGSTSVPSTFTYTLEFAPADGSSLAGLIADADVTTGSSFNDFWIKTGPGVDDWELQNFGAAASANFVASVTAVPEPGTVALMVLGLGGLVLAVRRRK